MLQAVNICPIGVRYVSICLRETCHIDLSNGVYALKKLHLTIPPSANNFLHKVVLSVWGNLMLLRDSGPWLTLKSSIIFDF